MWEHLPELTLLSPAPRGWNRKVQSAILLESSVLNRAFFPASLREANCAIMECKQMMKRLFAMLVCGLIVCLLPGVALADQSNTGSTDVPVGVRLTLPAGTAQWAYRLTDNFVGSRVSLSGGTEVTISPERMAGVLVLSWYTVPQSYIVTQTDASGAILAEETRTDGMLRGVLTLDAACEEIRVSVSSDCALGDVAAYAAGASGIVTRAFQPTPMQADLLIITAEPGMEFDEFGALLPVYAKERGMQVAVLYVSDYGKRERALEALDGLSEAGYDAYPIFGGFTCDNYDSYHMASIGFDREILTDYLKVQIALLNPKVVVTHSLADSSGARRFTGECALNAARASAGVSKCYTFGAAQSTTPTVIDMNTPLNAYNGKTAAEVAQSAYDMHLSRRVFGREIDLSSGYTLSYSNVGDDRQKNDLFENIDGSSLISYNPATPVAAAEATAAPETSASAAVMPAPEATPLPQKPEQAQKGVLTALGLDDSAVLLSIGLGVGGSVLMVLFVYRKLKRRSGRGDAICLCLVPFALGLAVSAILAGGKAQSPAPSATPSMDLAASVPTPIPEIATVSPVPTALPEKTEDPVALFEENYYRKSGDPAEVIVTDSEHGHWAYRTDNLGIDIERVNAENSAGKPVVYFAADIRVKDGSQFRPAFAAETHAGRGAALPWQIARREKAVLWITGDNLIHEQQEKKGILIRDGRVFWSANAEDTLAIYPDLSMRIIPRQSSSAQTLLEDGVENAYSSGPALISGGSVNSSAKYHSTTRANPRCGIGEIEPGHYIAIVVERRAMRDSVGLTLEEFASLFLDYGCETAYNLNGGRSAAMVFMGEQLNSHLGGGIDPDGSVQRTVADGLMFGYSNQVPGVNDPVYSDGTGQ